MDLGLEIKLMQLEKDIRYLKDVNTLIVQILSLMGGKSEINVKTSNSKLTDEEMMAKIAEKLNCELETVKWLK